MQRADLWARLEQAACGKLGRHRRPTGPRAAEKRSRLLDAVLLLQQVIEAG